MEQIKKALTGSNGSGIKMVPSAQLLETVFTQLKELGEDSAAPALFPNGLESVNLEVIFDGEQRQEFRLTLKSAGGADGQPTAPVILSGNVSSSDEDDTGITFNSEGHHVIARIAMADLQQNDPDIMTKVQKILDDGDRTITEAATFPDDIRNSQPQTKPFHFIDIPLEQGGPVNPPLPPAPHVLVKIDEFTAALKNGGTAQEQVDALSWLIHLFGDVHQPLHCIERTNELHPGGDRGGNSFKLKGKAKNLHSAWDSSVNVLHPGKDEQVLANDIMQLHSRQDLKNDLTITDTEKWARASYKLAKDNAYTLTENPSNPPKPSAAYLKNMEKVGQRQAALAGYRLADRLKEILG